MSIASRVSSIVGDEARDTITEASILEIMTRTIITGEDEESTAKNLAELLLMLRGSIAQTASSGNDLARETIDATLELIYLHTFAYHQAFEAWCESTYSTAPSNTEGERPSTPNAQDPHADFRAKMRTLAESLAAVIDDDRTPKPIIESFGHALVSIENACGLNSDYRSALALVDIEPEVQK